MRFLLLPTLFFSLCLSTTAQTSDHFDPQFFHQQEFAHRGGYAYGPENALETILDNINNGHLAIEVDVQMTKDHQLVLFHDKTISRILASDSTTEVKYLTLAELLTIPYRDHPNIFVPTLESLMDTLVTMIKLRQADDLIVELDFKPHGDGILKPAVEELLRILANKEAKIGPSIYNHFFVSSFYPFVLKTIREKNKVLKTAFAVNSNPNKHKFKGKSGVIFANMVIGKYDVQILEPNLCIITEKFAEKWHKKGILINGYTANTECQKAHLKKLQVAFTSNCPSSTCEPDASDQIENGKKWCKSCD